MKPFFVGSLVVALVWTSACSTSPTAGSPPASNQAELPGRKEDGSILLPNMWSLRPAGRQVELGDFPVNLAIHPGGRYAVALHSGYGKHEAVVVDLTTEAVVSRAALNEAFYGIAFSRDGRRLVCSGAGDEVIHTFAFADGQLTQPRDIRLRPAKERGIPSGIALSADGKTAYVANVWGQSVSVVDLDERSPAIEILLGTKNGGTTPTLPPAKDFDEASITKRAEALLESTGPEEPFPFTCVLDEKQGRLYVSLWAQSSVAVIDLATRQILARWSTEEHPNEMLLGKSGQRLYVANANRNSVSVLDTATGRTVETLVAELKPGSPLGNTPNSLALSPDGARLFVANANINTVAVFDLSAPGKSRSLGFIPTGWYPTSVRLTPDGKKLLVTNGKGSISKPNPKGPQPGVKPPPGTTVEYIGGLFQGSVGVVDLPRSSDFEAQMKRYTAISYAGLPLSPERHAQVAKVLEGNPVPSKPGVVSPIKYCIYIIKENRTYDQVLGDMKEGNGDPSLCLFPESVTPNHHQLARDFVLLDNFYVESEVSADGHEWSMGAYANDFVEKTWPLSYGHNSSKKHPYPSEGKFPIASPSGGYLWDVAKAAGVTYRSYGEFTSDGNDGQPGSTRVTALKGHFDPFYHTFDMDYPDQKRADRFISELNRFENEGEMPRLQIVRLPNDHTSGASVGKPTPTAFLADNDLAFGRVVEAVSKSKFWAQTAIFVVEDDAQNGPDHVDAHRTIAYAISPYIRRGSVDSTMYSTSSMLRTMELILGTRPMSQFDAAALPMFKSFQPVPDLRPYTARIPQTDLNAKTHASAWGVKESSKMNFAREDAADDLLLNEVIWRNVRGANSPMPAPKRAAFVFTHKGGDDLDD